MCVRVYLYLVLAAFVILPASSARSDVPQLVNYQGILEDPGGNPVTIPVNVTFSIYDVSTGGAAIWSELQTVTPDADGRFSVLLGSVTTIPDAAFDANAYLGVQVELDPEMLPRQRLVSVPYAYRVGSLEASAGGTINGVVTIADGQHLRGEISGGARILGARGDTPALPAIGFFSTNGVDDGGGGNGIYRPVANAMAFATQSTERMRIMPGGNLGIGTNAPQALLHVNGTTQFGGVATIAAGQHLRSAANGGARILGAQGNSAAQPAIGFFSTNGVDDGGGGNGIYRPAANAMAFATQSSERMRIAADGNVGIGTTSATSLLHVNGPIATAITTVTANTTLDETASVVLANNTGAAITIALPAASGCSGRQITIKKISGTLDGNVVIDGDGADQIEGIANFALTAQYQFVVLVSDGTGWWIVGT